jgi:hypothetical protein
MKLQDFIAHMGVDTLDNVEMPTAARDRMINELFAYTSKQGIQGWVYLANCLFFAISKHHGEQVARGIFKGSGPMPKKLRTALRNATVLDRLYRMKPKPNVAKLARELAKENKKLPKERHRGAGGINASTLEDHIRDLVEKNKKQAAKQEARLRARFNI